MFFKNSSKNSSRIFKILIKMYKIPLRKFSYQIFYFYQFLQNGFFFTENEVLKGK